MYDCLVTGASGLLGSYTTEFLILQGYSVLCVDVQPLPSHLIKLGAKEQHVNIGDYSTVLSLIQRAHPKNIVHLASLLTQEATDRVVESIELNIMGTVKLLHAATECGVGKFIYAGSQSMYSYYSAGTGASGSFDESSPVTLSNPYTISKYTCELVGKYYSRQYRLPFVSLRFPLLFGAHAGKSGGSFQKIMIQAIQRALRGEDVEIPDFSTCEILYAKDAARSVELALNKEFHDFEIYNIGASMLVDPMKLSEVLRSTLSHINVKITKRDRYVPGGYSSPQYPSDFSKAKSELGYAPKFGLADALIDCLSLSKQYTEWPAKTRGKDLTS